eukprot:NODE_96_length_21330_cov_0.419858.p8 type:complete len:153 gc:universal NODE_96_length_21330_cov_0.419858:14579-15037(+)
MDCVFHKMSHIVLSYLVRNRYKHLKNCMEEIQKINNKVLLTRLVIKSEYDMLFKNQKIIFRMRLQGAVFPKIVYKIVVDRSNVVHLNPRSSAGSSNHWRMLNMDLLLKKKTTLKSPNEEISRTALKSNLMQFDLEVNHFCIETSITINDLLN